MSTSQDAKAVQNDSDEPPAKRVKPSDDTAVKDDLEQQVMKLVESNGGNVVILDVRTVEEVLNDGFLRLKDCQKKNGGCRWLNVSCTAQECPLLEAAATNMIPNKKTPIIVHCKSGRRAERAKTILEDKGYTSIVNAGGFRDLDYLQRALLAE